MFGPEVLAEKSLCAELLQHEASLDSRGLRGLGSNDATTQFAQRSDGVGEGRVFALAIVKR